MKKLILIYCSFLSFTAMAQRDAGNIPLSPQYCAKLKNGRIAMMEGKKELSSDVVLENGNIIRTYGSILKTDGSIAVLRDGECVDTLGKPIRPKDMEQRRVEDEIIFPEDF